MFLDQRPPGDPAPEEVDTDPETPAKWPAPARLAFIFSSAALLWALIIWIFTAW